VLGGGGLPARRIRHNADVLVSFLLAAALTPGASASQGIDPRIFANRPPGERASFLVVFREQADLAGAAAVHDRLDRRRSVYEALAAQAEASQGPLGERLREAGIPFRSHFLVNMIEVEADEAVARQLAMRADVARIAPNFGAPLSRPEPRAVAPRSSPVVSAVEPNIAMVGAPELWALGYTGQGVVLGLADTGFEWDHPALIAHYRGWDGATATHAYNWHDAVHDAEAGNPCGSDSPEPCDDFPHGTQTAGLAVGDDGAGNRIGMAPGARLIGCRNMDGGFGTPSRYAECLEWLMAPTDAAGANPRPDLGADVVNNSWICPESEGCTDPDILRVAVENLRAAGIAMVGAAGNSGASCSRLGDVPAIYDAMLTVGATDFDDTIAGFSSFGPVTVDGSNRLKPDLTAPGVFLRTSKPPGAYASEFSGTSAAAPQVAGAVALLWSAVPELAGDVAATEWLLERSAVPLTYPIVCGSYSGLDVPNPVFGWGRLDVAAAFEGAATRWSPIRPRAPATPRPAAPRP
jgi:serine protease AprX